MTYLGNNGANLNLQGIFPFSAYLISFKNSISSGRNDKSASILAASQGHFDIVKYLADQGAKLDLQGMFSFL